MTMTTIITVETIGKAVKEVYVKLRPWCETPKTYISKRGDMFSITTNYDYLGEISQGENGGWLAKCAPIYGVSMSCAYTTLEEAITALIKHYWGMR